MNTHFLRAACGLALLYPCLSAADDCTRAERKTLIACALSRSPALREVLATQRALDGRLDAARLILPSNPAVSGSFGSRQGPTDRALNWSVGLAQELEVGGQRGLRVDVVESERRAQAHQLAATKAAIAAESWSAFFKMLAAQQRVALTERLRLASEAVAETVRGMVAAGLSSEVDADIAEASSLRAAQSRVRADQLLAVSRAQVRVLTGATEIEGALTPLRLERRAEARPELQASLEAQRANSNRSEALRRSVVPNPTLSLYAQNDGFNEQVFGVGLSVPIPIARTRSGEIAESVATAQQSEATSARISSELDAEFEMASAEYEASAKIHALYSSERSQRASVRLEQISQQVKAARLPVREALLAQQALVEQLNADLDAREALCLASVRLSRASGASLEGDDL